MTNTSQNNDDPVVARECRFAIHVPSKDRVAPDVHMVKEICHTQSGRRFPNIRFIKDYKRPFYITKPSKRSYKDKREFEHLDNVVETHCTQSELRDRVAKALGKAWSNEQMRQLASSPYLYGTDISSTSLIKHNYRTQWPDTNTPFDVAVFDIETDTVMGTEDIIMSTIVMLRGDTIHVVTSVVKWFVQGIGNLDIAVDRAMQKYITGPITGEVDENDGSVMPDEIVKFMKGKNIQCSLHVGDTVEECIRVVIGKAHDWKPDFLAIWNMDFDIPRVLGALEKAGVDPADVFSDPKVPKPFRLCRYKQGSKQRTTAAGKVIPVNPAAQWHTLISTSSFYVIDAMCSYKMLRLSEGEEPSYSLDAILTKQLGIRKLKFKEADEYQGLKWHQFMQSNYKIEYIIYNRFDCISMLLLDSVTKDLGYTLPEFAGVSDFWDFRSQPKRIADALHFFCLERGTVMGTAFIDNKRGNESEDDGDGVVDADDSDDDVPAVEGKVLGLDGWVK